MQLPSYVTEQIKQWLSQTNTNIIRQASQRLTQHYHLNASTTLADTPLQRLAYLTSRMPATFGACREVLAYLKQYTSPIRTILDLGAGPGTASIAALETFMPIESLTLVDRDPYFQEHALAFLQHHSSVVDYRREALENYRPTATYDLVISSYALNELAVDQALRAVETAWNAAAQFFVLIEPGTPVGFSLVKAAREQLLRQGAYIVAPCTHHQLCPMQGSDWCHFSTRIIRSWEHRLAKEATLPYEDEKYTYLIVARHAVERSQSRIIKRPLRRPGHVIFDLCQATGVKRINVSKKQKDIYTLARQKAWGDDWNE